MTHNADAPFPWTWMCCMKMGFGTVSAVHLCIESGHLVLHFAACKVKISDKPREFLYDHAGDSIYNLGSFTRWLEM